MKKNVPSKKKNVAAQLRKKFLYSEAILVTIPIPLLVLDSQLRVKSANKAFYKKFKVSKRATEKHRVYDLGNGQWNIPRLRELLEAIIPKNSEFENFEVEHQFESIGKRTMLLNARRFKLSRQELILLAIADISIEKNTMQEKIDIEKKSADLFHFIADAMPQKVWTADASGNRTYFNKQWLDYTGLTLLELQNEGWKNIIHPDDLAKTDNRWRQSVETGEDFEVEDRKLDKHGQYKWHLSRATAFKDEDGKVKMWIGTNTEVEKQKKELLEFESTANKRSRELAEQKDFSQTIVNTTADLIVVYDTKMRIIDFNKACEDLFQKKRAEVIGKTITEVFPSAKGSQGEKDIQRSLQGETIHNAMVQSPVTGRYYETFMTPLKNTNGEIYATVVIAHDITGSINSMETLKQSEEKFSRLFESSPFSISLTDDKGKIVDVNEKYLELIGYSREEVIGHTSLELNMLEKTLRDKIYQQLGEQGSIKNAEVEIRVKSGNMVPVLVSTQTVSMGGRNYFLHALNDITDRKKSESEIQQKNRDLEKMNRELEAFNYISSHDLQEPLRKIQAFALRLLQNEEQNLSETGRYYFQRMRDAANRMQTLIQDLLIFSRLKSSEIEFEMIDFIKLIEEVKCEYKEALAERNGTVELGEICDIKVMGFQFRQVMNNLFSNAIKFSKPDTPLRINLSCKKVKDASREILNGKPSYHIIFSDNSIGFEQHFSEKVFQLFQRLHGQDEYPGTGIGMAIVKKIIENHGGTITVTSALNEGVRYDIYIPIT